jgi:ABC-2 type transport system ATP-binding protein
MSAGAMVAAAAGRFRAGAAVVETVELTKIYAGSEHVAVDRLGLTVGAGEIFGLLGPNGAGKTTTAGMLTTRVVPTSGEAFVGGIDVVAEPALVKQLIGVVSQQNTLDRALSVWENLYFHGLLFGVPRREARRRSDELLERFRLSRWGEASVYALSGGMAQRLTIARAILHRPAILFLDEPTAGLDPQSRLALWDMLEELNAEGQTILLMTHYMEEAEKLCDRVAIMDHGRILALDTPALLKRSIGADAVVMVRATRAARAGRERQRERDDAAPSPAGGNLADAEELSALLAEAIEGVTRTRIVTGAVEIHVDGSAAGLLPRVVSAAEAQGFEVVDLSVSEPSLETVFITLTGRELRD